MAKVKQATIRNKRYKSPGRAQQHANARKKRKIAADCSSEGAEVSPQLDVSNTSFSQPPDSDPIPSTSGTVPLCTSAKKMKAFESISKGPMKADFNSEREGNGATASTTFELADLKTRTPLPNGDLLSKLPSTICDLNQLQNLFALCPCPMCFETTLKLSADKEKSRGMAVFLELKCLGCGESVGFTHTSGVLPPTNCFEVNSQCVMASILNGFGAEKWNKVCEMLGVPGENSICFYNRALAQGLPPPPHKDNMSLFIRKDIAQRLLPIYKKMADRQLLSRCLSGKTQNANESLHSVIWSRCQKDKFSSRDKVEVAILLGVGMFNMGATASHTFMASHGLCVSTENTQRLGKQRDKARTANSASVQSKKQQRRRQLRREAQEKERQKQLRREQGPAYVPGDF